MNLILGIGAGAMIGIQFSSFGIGYATALVVTAILNIEDEVKKLVEARKELSK